MNFDRLKILVSAKSKKNKSIDEHKVLIVFQQIFGDAIVVSDSLFRYSTIFPKEDGYSITFIARPAVINFMKSVLPLDESITYEEVDFGRLVNEYKYFRQVVEHYSDVGVVIVPGTSLSAEVLTLALPASRKIGLMRPFPIEKPFLMSYLYKNAYTEQIVPSEDEMMLQRHRRLLNYLGDKEYRAKLPCLKEFNKVINYKEYVVIAPGASKSEKCWPTDRFAEIINWIWERYQLPVVLCGGSEEIRFEQEILKSINDGVCIESYIGKSTFEKWAAIIQHASLVVGNDSATLHLAAASKVKSICIAGLYDKYQFFPYQVDILCDDEILPETVMASMPCEYCRTKGYYSGFGNKRCKQKIKDNKCSLCIENITISAVQDRIIKIIEE